MTIDPGDTSSSPRDKLRFRSREDFEKRAASRQLKGRVLVVDDLRDIRELISHMVQSSGATVTHASNGLQAVSAVDSAKEDGSPYDLVLMDIHMPEMDGTQAVSTLRSRGHTLPIVALTAASMRGSREKLLDFGFNDLLTKPIDPSALHQVLENHLRLVDDETPLQTPAPSHATTDPQANQIPPSDTTKIHALVLEDDLDAAQALADLLSNFNVQVTQARTIQEASQLIGQQHWHAVLLDMHLPDGHGLDFIKNSQVTLIEQHSYVTIVSGDTPDPKDIAELPVHHVLLKPIQLGALKQLVNNIRHHHCVP